jgi:4-amino-4-deoxy-L-arabinose transferase-like glycosyltransferase
MAVPRNSKTTCEIKKSLMDLNTFVFGGISLVSLAIFFYFGRFRASSKQRDREDRIDWGKNRFGYLRILLLAMLCILVIALIIRMFTS